MKPLRVLYMEADAALATDAQRRLELAGLRVDVAANGESGMIMHRVRSYDVLLLAQELPVRSGLDVVWSLSSRGQLPATIMLAEQGDAETAVQALKLGVGDYVIKDEGGRFLDMLSGCVQQVVRDRRERDEKDAMIASFREKETVLKRSNATLRRMAALDGLTGIANRRYFDDVLEREWRRGLERGTSISLVLADVDSFKAYNDRYGHLAGDDALKQIARVFAKAPLADAELAARYGGEEFGVILSQRTDHEATSFANQLRKLVQGLQIQHEGSQHGRRVHDQRRRGDAHPDGRRVALADDPARGPVPLSGEGGRPELDRERGPHAQAAPHGRGPRGGAPAAAARRGGEPQQRAEPALPQQRAEDWTRAEEASKPERSVTQPRAPRLA